MPSEERVLVIHRSIFDRIGCFQGLSFEVEKYLDSILPQTLPHFEARSKAENDPNFKQIIPYVLLTCDGKYLSYVRGKQAGEKRLVGQRSIGIGGHINPIDHKESLFTQSARQVYDLGVIREVTEEVFIDSDHSDHVVALLNDDSTEVGRVHLGIVHCWVLESPIVRKSEKMIKQPEFLSRAELRATRPDMETWSAFCVDHLDDIERRLKASR